LTRFHNQSGHALALTAAGGDRQLQGVSDHGSGPLLMEEDLNWDLNGRFVQTTSYLHDASELGDLRVPPGNRLESLKGEWRGFYSIRINDQWRVVFRWQGGHAADVRVVDYH